MYTFDSHDVLRDLSFLFDEDVRLFIYFFFESVKFSLKLVSEKSPDNQ